MIVLDYLYFHPFKFGALSMAMCDAGLTQQVLNSQYHPPWKRAFQGSLWFVFEWKERIRKWSTQDSDSLVEDS